MPHDNNIPVERREFLRALGASAGVAAVAAAPLATETTAAESESEMKKARYRETEEVRTFYRVNSYPR